jgi:lon-related putative ATP-dependent protease
MSAPRPLEPGDLRAACAPDDVPVDGTAEAAPRLTIGQDRALEALALATEIQARGYNVFATGVSGTGKRATLGAWLRERAAGEPSPPDTVYVFNFADPRRPRAFSLPTGSAPAFAADVDALVDGARGRIREAFESESYRTRHRELHDRLDRRRTELLRELEQRAETAGVGLQLTPAGVMTVPIAAGRPLKPDEIEQMPDELRERYEHAVEELKAPVQEAFARIHALEREAAREHQELNREVALFAASALVDETRGRWEDVPGIPEWLDAVREDVIGNLDLFRASEEAAEGTPPALEAFTPQRTLLTRYAVNVLVTREPGAGAPVVFATDPSFLDLFGRAEYETAFGATVTDHRHLQAGAVHRAAGGYLVLDAAELLTKPFVWPRLKDVLRTGETRIENIAAQYLLFPGVALDPEPVPVEVTVVLLGSTQLYDLLHAYDDDTARLFKLRADFTVDLPRDPGGIGAYAELLAGLRDERGLPDFTRDGVAAMVEHGSRLAGHRDRLTTRVRDLGDVATEAGHVARAAGAPAVGREHVAAALAARRRRSSLLEERLRTETLEGTLRVDLDGARPGQVNGLAVSALAGHAFGHPVRITATAGAGDGKVVDVDREVELSGPVHDKGFLILSGFLVARYASQAPLSLRASLVFEQSYGPIEGDSASVAELVALLSALADVPIRQAIAITGSVDQHGRVQAVGGVNEKVEGFFALAREHGLSGEHGVIVPQANVRHLMLDAEVVDAARDGRFHVWPVATIDEALELACGIPAGATGADGGFPEGTLNARAAARLAAFLAAAKAVSGDGA